MTKRNCSYEETTHPSGQLGLAGDLHASKEFNQRPVELLWTFFIRQMSNPRKNNQLRIRKEFRQWLSRRNIHRSILTAPHKKCRNTSQLRQSSFQLEQILSPGPHNAQSMLKQSRLRQRS